MFRRIKKKLSPYYTNLRGWRTDRKIVVIESDDWGSIRMPSRDVYEKCLKAGYQVNKIAYEKYDSLASEMDLELLFDLLASFRDKNGSHPVITANVLAANPDFDKISESEFTEYHYELITETFKKYSGHKRCFNLWKEGLHEGLFYPQSHGREHLNVSMFMNALQERNRDALFGFDHKMPGSIPRGDPTGGNKYVESLRYSNETNKWDKLEIVLEGLDLFEDLFGYRSESFIPPNYIWSNDFNEEAAKKGVRFLQGNRKMKEPDMAGGYRLNSHVLGEQNAYKQLYLVRNSSFEPSLMENRNNAVGQCLSQVNAAFRMRKPAIITSHRLNYVGFIDECNRDQNLRLLELLLKRITATWPEVEFMNSVHLGIQIDKYD
ncbi:hypothetical protein [Rhodohalobacter sp. 8-1]|uniref:hypothetical protein n=1 Tax=Rhodohalobacter sp. 8-1 TaxID=3131972 RepID=UPI0030EEED5F